MKKMNPKDILVPAVSLFVICVVATALLALVNSITKDKIQANTLAKAAEARQTVLAEAKDFKEVDKDSDGTVDYYEGVDGTGNVVGYVFDCSGDAKGYGGDVSVTVGIDTEGKITGIQPDDVSNETPGLGQNSDKASWKAQFVGESGDLTVVKSDKSAQDNTSDGKINAITSATITSKAVTSSVNAALDMYDEIGGTN
ncbi:MAG: RnfABCDGE type electron transport complex subunit G [Clostridia bacterium]|nr:RnfABCDGE type electron transport complex subunit G [Clostridia bacterium]MBR5976721.1 RnfABCDGE type electron transport complex subunit G [Clostridia bacterium]MBR5991376.1 RnfABCDGE type electron transport complex subunit G [Clostridia bacterium]MBR6479785.1 RnfABCDGE type electron transport complex subunit G [Clostridia bacterium]MBR6511976.1 RnfABCDGE type electron transport complex subunit G [Clostridia bacterium]